MTFNSRHESRDETLPVVREHLLRAALDDLGQDPDVAGVYLAGSLPKANDDQYSDIDLHIVVTRESRDTFIDRKRERPTRWGPVLFYEDVNPKRPVMVVHFEAFVKVDTWYHLPEELQPSLWLCGCQALYDPKSIIQPVLDASETLKYQVTPDEVELWRGKVFAYIHEVYRSVMRGELYYAISMLDSFRWQMARGWHMEMGQRVDSGWGVWSKVEGTRSLLSGWQSALLKSWYCQLDEDEIMKTLASMIPELLRLHGSLCRITGVEERREWCESVISKVL